MVNKKLPIPFRITEDVEQTKRSITCQITRQQLVEILELPDGAQIDNTRYCEELGTLIIEFIFEEEPRSRIIRRER